MSFSFTKDLSVPCTEVVWWGLGRGDRAHMVHTAIIPPGPLFIFLVVGHVALSFQFYSNVLVSPVGLGRFPLLHSVCRLCMVQLVFWSPRYTFFFFWTIFRNFVLTFVQVLHCFYTGPQKFCTVPEPVGTVIFCLPCTILNSFCIPIMSWLRNVGTCCICRRFIMN